MPKRRHEAIRTCVACRQPAGKRGLVRLCRDGAGLIQVDPGGRAPGRGAYLHEEPDCATLALRRKALQRALRGELGPQTTIWLEEILSPA